jgi:pimeloyl-ACP methyl ester carboxylesterase
VAPPLLLVHGFMDSSRVWDLVLPALERRHDVLAPTLPGHAGGPPIPGHIDDATFPDYIEHVMDEAGWDTAHIAGNSLGGFVALQLAERGRARSVVALAPAGGWAEDDPARERLLRFQRELYETVKQSAAHADAIASTPEGRRRATEMVTVRYEHIPAELIADQIRAVAHADARPYLDYADHAEWNLDAERIDCPVRIVWGTADRLLEWPAAAHRFRHDWLPNADWVELDDVGHCPQLDVPLETAELISGFALSHAPGGP